MAESISLAEWIAALRAELAEAVAWQEERTETTRKDGRTLGVAPLTLGELKIEMEVRTTRDQGLKGGLKFWVLSGDVEKRRSESLAQKVTLVLHPTSPIHLGDDKGFLDE